MRAIWNGALTFGLINIPVKVYSAAEERALKFRLLDRKTHSPISYSKVRKTDGKEVSYDNIVKGYEYQKGEFVIVDDTDFEKASPKKTQTVEIESFVEEQEVESKLINKPYFIEPDKKAEKAYALLREALTKVGKVGVGKIVFHDKEHLAMVKPEKDVLMLMTLRYKDELRSPEDLHIPGKLKFTKKEIDLAIALVNQLEDKFDITRYKDTYAAELKKIIEKKAKGRPIKVPRGEPVPTYTEMKDLMETLKASLEKSKTHA